MSTRSHLTVYGATGFTAKAVVAELWKGGSKRWPSSFKWTIAGRNRSALESLRNSLAGLEESNMALPDIVLADVHNQESLNDMASKTHLVLNCVGPYRDYGEPVVKACLESQTDYIDLCGEPAFIERMHLQYHEKAVKKGLVICHAVAFDSVPCDLGVELCKKILRDKNALPSTVEMFLTLNATRKPVANFTTYEAAIKGFASTKELRDLRKRLATVRPKPAPPGPPLNVKLGGANAGLLGRAGVGRDPRRNSWLVPYFFSDPAVVRLSQSLQVYLSQSGDDTASKASPVHFAAHLEINSLRAIFLFIFYFIIFQFLAVREWGRELLYRYPGLFTHGVVRKGNIRQSELEGISFAQTFYARGFSSPGLASSGHMPNVGLTLRIAGPEAGYVATPIIFLEVASVLLRKRDDFKKGVLTPAVAFGHLDIPAPVTREGEGGVMNALQRDGRVTWSILESQG
ncbi:hypothetical protein M422DRAFT_251242 [Sphaerobolus stellatus SS14]|uniref:Saccharopine dehydrogenase NADP binding domain-containing protein n=1 Tax=Sphaerobolus stellatus (strain SS14) TaxID=990650 RepID=A0A0C9UQ51_SPHS4|nr:hypothetical protein M422DRAFT_251242 [Sphaerobolus stellatus SS14]